jgi:DNA-binding CsgD family transcriptional regulator
MPALAARARTHAPGPDGPLPDGLSARELEVLRLVARGLSNREIGASLFISEHTAANHVRSILRKTDSSNRTEATAYAYRRGLVER